MRAGRSGVPLLAGALLVTTALGACAPTGTAAEVVSPTIEAVNPELATLPDIAVEPDIPYGADPLQRLDACLPPAEEPPAAPAADPVLPEVQPPDPPARAAIVLVHGGSWTRGDKADVAWRAICQWLASEGFVALSLNYRLAPEHVFPAAIDDVQLAVAWLREPAQVARFRIDPDRIGAMGGSAGGNLVALLGTRGTGGLGSGSRVAAVAELSGPTELTGVAVTDDFVPVELAYLGCDAFEGCPDAVAASPVYEVDAGDPPFLVAHSTDEMIPLEQAELFVAALRAASVPVEFVVARGNLHSVAMLDADLKQRIVDFFDERIGTPREPVAG